MLESELYAGLDQALPNFVLVQKPQLLLKDHIFL